MLIEKETLLKQMEGYCSANCGHEHGEDPLCPSCFMNDAIILVEDQPAADVRPVVRGKWNRTDAYPHRLYCSVCYKTYLKNDELLERWEFPLNFCPNCGADMSEDRE